jgi:isopentenyl-diphosphate Delta-isomerase
MSEEIDSSSKRKKEHIELCLTNKVSFKEKKNGFNHYDFDNYSITEIKKDRIDFTTTFLKKKINYPFLISCMTGGITEAENINVQLAIAANELNIPLGVGSQRRALENKEFQQSYKIIRKEAPKIPLLGNLGASQIVKMKNLDPVKYLIDMIEADGMVIHLNPAQELFQSKGEADFSGLLNKLEKLVKRIKVPIIAKEVGSGISGKAARKLLEIGIKGIDVAGSGGTSWTGVELLRSGDSNDNPFWDWGLPTSYCLKEVFKLKKEYKFTLIGSGGINTSFDAAKAFALGADIAASARVILQELVYNGVNGVQNLITGWFDIIRKIMFLTGANELSELRNKIILKEELY